MPQNGIDQQQDWFSSQAQPEPRQDARWRDEVAERVQAHRARRRNRGQSIHTSLPLNFEPATDLAAGPSPAFSLAATAPALAEEFTPQPLCAAGAAYRIEEEPEAGPAFAYQPELSITEAEEVEEYAPAQSEPPARFAPITFEPEAESAAEVRKIIEFPRLATVEPPPPLEELAEPVQEWPRILESNDEAMRPLEPSSFSGLRLRCEEEELLLGELDLPLQVAPLGPRLYAAAMDALIVSGATAIFGMIFVTMSRQMPEKAVLLVAAVLVPGLLWSIYQFLFLLLAQTTPGLQMADLHLATFDGAPLTGWRRLARASAGVLSAVSLGMGFAWALIDQDHLAWHDRITRTFVQQR